MVAKKKICWVKYLWWKIVYVWLPWTVSLQFNSVWVGIQNILSKTLKPMVKAIITNQFQVFTAQRIEYSGGSFFGQELILWFFLLLLIVLKIMARLKCMFCGTYFCICDCLNARGVSNYELNCCHNFQSTQLWH